jgi:general stress protein 26
MTADTRSGAGPEPQTLDTVQSIMNDVRTCMFVTTADDGSLHAAPMTTQEAEFDGDAWFLASSGSETVRNLTSRPQVNVSYAGSNAWLSLTGTASVVDDVAKKKALWNTFTEAWFPEGENDPSVVVVKVSGHSAQYWDSPGRIAMTLDMVKARITGSPPKSGDSKTVDLQS